MSDPKIDRPKKQKYGLDWLDRDFPNDLDIEFYFIRQGGHVKIGEKVYGLGKEHHYTEAAKLLWPDDDWHRWFNLCWKRIIQHEICVMMGASDSGKTYVSAKYVLTDWWANSENTLWMISSTELRGAELRIWGKIKELFNRARKIYPNLPGNVLESKHAIATEAVSDDNSEARLLTKGIIFIPCISNGQWKGLGNFAGVKPTKDGRIGHVGDEASFMQNSFLKAYANWYGKPNFKGILQGNPIDLDDPLCVAAEPADGEGWKDWKDTEKTQEWRSKWYNAWVIALDGRDSPNMDYPANRNPFPYLVGRKKLESVAEVEGKDSDLFWMQCIGKPRPGAEIRRIITRQLCESGKAFEPVVWEGSSVTDVVSLDAAYGGEGGDRCVLTHLQFGKDVDGTSILFYAGRYNVPVTHRVPEKPEVQIATFCKNWCEARKIPPAHFFYDARSTLADAFGKWWSPEVNAVDFGGLPTDRPVSNEHYVLDEVTKVKRLKRCNEHYSKFVTELWFSAHYLILYQQLRGLVREVAEEGWKRQWHPTKGSPPRVEAETKADMKERTTYSPDNFDSFVTGIEGARRLGFQIGKLSNAALQGKDPFEYLQNQANKFRTSMKKQELRYN